MRKDKELLIYIVDDDPIYSTFIWSYFDSKGYKNIVTYKNAQVCLDQLFRMPDLVILDYQMDDIDGLVALKSIKSFDPDIPVVLLSGKGGVQVAVDSLKYGGLDYIVKDDEALDNIWLVLEKIKKIRLIEFLDRRKKFRKRLMLGLIIPLILILISIFL